VIDDIEPTPCHRTLTKGATLVRRMQHLVLIGATAADFSAMPSGKL
jgi:hypothetical protein